MPVRTVVEHGTKDKKSVAFGLDWPGWSRGAKVPEVALETLEAYRDRYRPIAELAGMAADFDAAGRDASDVSTGRAGDLRQSRRLTQAPQNEPAL